VHSVNLATGDYLAEPALFDGVDESGSIELGDIPAVLCPMVEARATNIYRSLLIDAPALQLLSSPLEAWTDGIEPLRWHANDPSGALVPIGALSSAQERWAAISVRMAMLTTQAVVDKACNTGTGQLEQAVPRILFIDEPELGLHPTAQRFLASGLQGIVEEIGLQVVLATHAPALLAEPSRLRHVRRNRRGRTTAVELPTAFVTDLADLGLQAADLVQLTRAFVIVEGRHDELVLEHVIGDELRNRSVVITPMRGASRINSVLDARFMFDFTDAKVIVVIDNMRPGIAQAWLEATRLRSAEDGRAVLLDRLDRKSEEERFLQEFGIRALEFGEVNRVAVCGLSVPDIVDLLPPSIICERAGTKSWAQLRADPRAPKGSGKFKLWAEKELGAQFDDGTIIRASEALDEIPLDLRHLLAVLDAEIS